MRTRHITMISTLLVACGGGGGASTLDGGGEGSADGGRLDDAGETLADAGTLDAGTLDAGTLDAGTLDAGTLDAGTLDAGMLDAGMLDGGIDGGLPDAGLPDAGSEDAGIDAGPLSVPCGGGTGDHLLYSGLQPGLPRIDWDGSRFVYALFSRTGVTAADPLEGYVGFADATGSATAATRVTPDDGESSIWPRVVAGTHAGAPRYGVVYLDDRGSRRGAYFALLDGDGAVLLEERLSSDPETVSDHALAWSPATQTYAAAWSGSAGVQLTRFDSAGTSLGTTTVRASGGLAYTGTPMIWADDRFALVSGGGGGEIVEVMPDGSVGDRHALGASGIRFTLGWSGGEYGVAWQLGGALSFLRVDGDGVVAGSERELDAGPGAGEADLVWNGSEWGVTWASGNDVWFNTITSAGAPRTARRLTTGAELDWWPSMTWCGQYVVVYEHGSTGVGETGELRLVFP